MYRFIYQTTMYRNSHYMLAIAGLAIGYEYVNKEISHSIFLQANKGFLQHELRRKITDERTEAGEPTTWNWGIHHIIDSPNKDNFELKCGNPCYLMEPGN